MIPTGSSTLGGSTDYDDSDNSNDSDDGTTTSTSDGSTSYADFREAESDAGLHDEGYAGAIDTQDNDDDAVVDEADEAQEIVDRTDQSAEEVVETFEDTQPRPEVDDVAPDATPDDAQQNSEQSPVEDVEARLDALAERLPDGIGGRELGAGLAVLGVALVAGGS